MVREDITKLNRAVLCALITIKVHARDNISALVASKVDERCDCFHASCLFKCIVASSCVKFSVLCFTMGRTNFEWLKQLRYYWEEDIDNCLARMSTSHHVYGYEYLGASPRLVITPLTDRCYLCLMGALQLDLGVYP